MTDYSGRRSDLILRRDSLYIRLSPFKFHPSIYDGGLDGYNYPSSTAANRNRLQKRFPNHPRAAEGVNAARGDLCKFLLVVAASRRRAFSRSRSGAVGNL